MNFLWAAYSVVWVIIFAYLFYMGKKQDKIIKEIKELKELKELYK